jgi:Ni/Fe-hydrogenase subunit HybB-like protein
VLAAALVWGAFGSHEARAAAALTTSWLFFAGAVAGALALSAILELSGAAWAQPFHAVVARLSLYLPVAAGILIVLAIFVPVARGLDGGAGLFFFAREVACGVALFAFGRFTLRGDPGHSRPAWVLVVYCLLFAVVVSVWAFDFVVMPSPGLANTLAGPHLFVGAFVSGLAFVVIGALRAGTLDTRQRRDASMLVVAFGVLWAYLFWSQLLTFWYGNLPDEMAFLTQRSAGGWSIVSVLVVATTLAVPFGLLLGSWGKRSTRVLAVAAASQLLGLWLERQLLVEPSVAGGFAVFTDPCGALTQLGMAAVFVVSTWPWAERPVLGTVSSPVGRPAAQAAAES